MQTTTTTGDAHQTRAMARRTRRGFSLLELTLVIAIIGVLMTVATINIVGAGNRAKNRATLASMDTVANALTSYRLEQSGYPASLQVLVDAQYLDSVPQDGWGNPFYYAAKAEGRDYELISYGEDGLPSTEDDLVAALELNK